MNAITSRRNGTAGINAPYPYSGRLALNVADLGTFEPLLRALQNKTELAGALAINWEGNGALQTFKNTGALKLTLKDGRYANLNKVEATVDANYTPEELNVPIIYAASDKLMFQAIMQAKGSTLEMTKIQIIQGAAKYADGYVSVPFVWGNLGSDRPLFASDGKVLINFQTENLDINKLTKDFGAEIPVAGLANVKFDAQGTLESLRADFRFAYERAALGEIGGFHAGDVRAEGARREQTVGHRRSASTGADRAGADHRESAARCGEDSAGEETGRADAGATRKCRCRAAR